MKDRRTVVIKGAFNLLGLGAAALTGYYAYDRTSSWWLVAFVVMMTLFAVGRAIPDLMTEPDKGRRALFYGTPLAFAIGGLAGAQAIWSTWWVSVVVGFAIGGVGWMVVTLALPEIARQEQEDSAMRITGGLPERQAVPPQFAGMPQMPTTPPQLPGLDPVLAKLFQATRDAGITFTPDEEQAIVHAHAAGNDDEVARLFERKLPKAPAGV